MLAPDFSDGKAKNISLAPGGAVRGAVGQANDIERIRALMVRFSTWARSLIVERAPSYAGALEMGRTSFRPRAVDDEPVSPRKDDRRLHVDAFASQPTGAPAFQGEMKRLRFRGGWGMQTGRRGRGLAWRAVS